MKKILLVFGTRPEAIKMAPLVKALQRDTEHFETKVCVTAQHRQMLVHGDTTTSMAASLAAFYRQVAVGHVEAGLRTYDMLSPWPEEMNRQVTDRICTYYFAPTGKSKQNLLQENIDAKKIFVTGNTVIDGYRASS